MTGVTCRTKLCGASGAARSMAICTFLTAWRVPWAVLKSTSVGRWTCRLVPLIVNGKAIRVTAEKDPANLKWNEVGAEYVVESTGLFLTKEKAQGHIDAGAKYVVMSAPSKDDTPMFVCGVNHNAYEKGTKFVSNASCTTNCLAQIGRAHV